MSTFPRQKLSLKKKLIRDKVSGKTWGERCIDYIADESISSTLSAGFNSDARFLDGGELITEDYEHILNPLNTTVDRYKKFGAKLRNYDIITPVRNLYIGEWGKRIKTYNVMGTNPDDKSDYKDGLNSMIDQYYQQKLINNLNEIGINTGKPSLEQSSLENAINDYNKDYDSNRIISGQEVLDYIHFSEDLDEKYMQLYNDWISFGAAISYKEILHDDVKVHRVAPNEISLPNNYKGTFVEDAPRILRRTVMTGNEIIDKWRHDLTDDEIEWLEKNENSITGTNTTGLTWLPTQYIGADDKFYANSRYVDGFEVCHVQWRSKRKIGILTYINALGVTTEMEVDEDYKFSAENGDISIKWEWITQIWEGERIGDTNRYIYKGVKPLPYNRSELNNSSKQKLSYNGRINRGVNGKVISLPSVGKPYQIIFNIVKYQFEKIINKNKEKIMVMPQGLFPTGVGGWDEEKSMYYMNADGMLIIDETQPTAGLALQGIKVLDMSLGQFVKDSIDILKSIKDEWWDAIGMNRQRYGDTMASDGKGVTEQAIYRSAIISEELNRKFEKYQEKDYESILDLSKLAFIRGKKGNYINSEGRKAFLEINADGAISHLESDYDIHVVNTAEETENIKMAKDYGFSLGQNAEAPSMMELIGSKNFEKTKEIIYKIDALAKQREQAMQQDTLASNEKVAEMNKETADAKNDTEKYKADKDYDAAIDSKILELNLKQADNQTNGGDNDSIMDSHKMQIDRDKLRLDRDEFNQKKKESNQKIAESKAKVRQLNKPVNNN